MKKEKLIENTLLVVASGTIIVLGVISLVIFVWGLPIIFKTGVFNFLFGTSWLPSKKVFGILPMIVGSIQVTLGALLFSVPLGLGCAIFLAEFAPKRVANFVRPAIQLLAGIPSVVYGFIGLIIVVPLIRTYFGGPGLSILAGSIILGIMVLPTMISISQDSLEAVPRPYKEGSLALGATHWQTITRVILPSASSGIFAGTILGIGRAVGETMATIMVVGNAPVIATSILKPARTLTSNIALEMAYASGEHRLALFATGVVLFIFIMLLNILAGVVARRKVSRS
jgi:phosphate transport system permease protein